MKPANFELLTPKSLAEAVLLLAEHHEDAKLISGGQSLVPAMNMRLATPKYLIDLNRVQDLDYLRAEGAEIVIGGMTRHHTLETSPLLRQHCPLLADAAGLIGHLAIRYRGTIGGSLAHADPAATLPVAVTALGGSIKAVGAQGERTFAPEEFFYGIFTTPLQSDELLAEVRVPVMPRGTGHSFLTLTRRHGDFPLVSAAALVQSDGRQITGARLAIGGVNSTPALIDGIGDVLAGSAAEEGLLAQAADLAAAAMEPETDLHATAEYRLHMVRVFAVRALKAAWERTREADH